MSNTQWYQSVTSIVGVVLMSVCTFAWPQCNRPGVGDLVEYVSGLGPTLGEIIVAPDASDYVMLLIPNGEKIPVNAAKLRLVQTAGAPNASILSASV
jgi:hypothetical protein